MGDFKVRKINNAHDRRKMYQYALNDVEAFEHMLDKKMFENGPPKIGAEQELCVVDQYYDPATSALDLLDSIKDNHFTNELALFNMEINLDPLPLSGNCFSGMETSLLQLMGKGYQAAAGHNSNLLMTGILPTLKYRHLQFEYMTPIRRYKTISQTLSELRGKDFDIHLEGVDEVIMSLGSVLFEACNTSFQLHLQIDPDEFVDRHNWSQMIAGPVLSACVNSPMLFGNELWAETRIALFKQSLDTRSSQRFMRKKLPRVYFGNDWLQHSPAELWKNDIMRFPLLVTSDDLKDSQALLKNGEIPDLRGIRLHNGTTYTWNRMCYGFSKNKPHLRIECRYLPAGPSAIDEIANFAFWIGLMSCEPPQGVHFWKQQDFKVAKNNFIKAAHTGLSSVFDWFGENISAKKLILEKLIPMARKGLIKSGVEIEDVDKYLSVLEKRVNGEVTGADWMVKNYRKLSKNYVEAIAEKELVRQSLEYQKENIPVHEWDNYSGSKSYPVSDREAIVEQLMSTDVYTVNKNVSIDLVKSIMKWNNFHHLPVEDLNGDLVGLITDGMLERIKINETEAEPCFAKSIMLTDLIIVEPSDTVEVATRKMKKNRLKGLPVVYNKKLIGIITLNDLEKLTLQTKYSQSLNTK